MIIAVSTQERKREKSRMAKMLKEYRITMKDVEAECDYHYQTVRNALNSDSKYWNQNIIDLAERLILEKQNKATTAPTNS
ncbi:hypothetical protein [Chitinophaga tropicalis]|uniref:Uncharacterized protein n=1 Tax=Chitinophaga tropicalis TaxID=2683588 RepID=A0A7K1UAE8_9BACT|nr:hypothetical protein [Chitinophaga tropicalis]MVT11339.1 hypothetical protein [Chitinophaga tropicalis]